MVASQTLETSSVSGIQWFAGLTSRLPARQRVVYGARELVKVV
jgi:hypothetical protein